MKRFLIVCAAIVAGVGTIARAQLTNNPYTVNTTNTTALTPVASSLGQPTYGFGVALLGYPMVTPGSTNAAGQLMFADSLDGVALSDATTLDANTLQFYAANEDNWVGAVIGGSRYAYNIVGYHVLQSASNPNSLTVCKSFAASVQTNAPVTVDSGYGNACAGTMGLGGVSKSGTIVIREDGTVSPCGTSVAAESILTLSAQVPRTTIITNALEPLANGGRTLAIDWDPGNVPQIGQNGLVVKNSFDGFSYVCRPDIFNNSLANYLSASSPNPSNGTNNQCFVSGISTVVGIDNFANWNTRGVLSINETAKMMANFIKTSQDLGAGGDSETGLAVFKYNDAGGPISLVSLQTNVFGQSAAGNFVTGGTSGITTNAQYFFGRVPFVGPAEISINDNGAIAFPVSINVDQANDQTNGTRLAQITGIIYEPPGSSSFLKVCDNTNPNLFSQVPMTCTNKNLICDVALDNYGNVYFEADYSNNTAFACDQFPSNAVYDAVANDPTTPTSWSVRILVRQGDTFTNTVSGDVFKITNLAHKTAPGGSGTSAQTVSSRSFGPNAINRTQLPGHTAANTVPSSAFAVGGILVQATLSNITQNIATDGLLYIAPYTSPCGTLPFEITSVTRSGNDINLTYNAQTGTNIIEVLAGGNYVTSGYTQLATNIVTGCPASANYTDVGGGTGSGNRYYRVRLIQP
jgi:hypothetical protein